jgi:ERCC4-type nuclease
MTEKNRFHIIKDTREKKGHGWWYDENAYCSGTTVAKVDIGDYTIEGMEHLLCIERKESVSEFAGNCSEKRFFTELKRMGTFSHMLFLYLNLAGQI